MGQCTFTKHEGRWRCSCSTGTHPTLCGQHRPDPRDAEIARLKAEVERLTARITDHEDDRTAVLSERCATDEHHCACVPVLRANLAAHKRALAAGPARLRALTDDLRGEGNPSDAEAIDEARLHVEAAQEAAMKEGT